jgi:thermostable 8-oxoguanine DNA glycosylase
MKHAAPMPKAAHRKWPGVGFALGAEFLRNVGWNGFKPDRHIKRLLQHWTKGQIDVQPQLNHLITLIDSSGAELKENLSCLLTGISIATNDYKNKLSHLDNLIWLLGAYVEKKNKETDLPYVIA